MSSAVPPETARGPEPGEHATAVTEGRRERPGGEDREAETGDGEGKREVASISVHADSNLPPP